MVILTLYLFNIFLMIYSHEESQNSLTDSSDDLEVNQVRRTIFENSDNFNSLTIEVPPSRRSNENPEVMTGTVTSTSRKTTTSVTTTTARNWQLSRRFRRIYNPDESALIEDYPFMAALLVNKQMWCAGAIINYDTVLTAAHCLQLQYNNRFFREYVKMLTVRVGSNNATSGGEVYRVTEIFFHPNYKPNTLEFNVAVLKLHKNISERTNVNADVISFSRNKVIPTDTQITFLGWGSVLGYGGTGGEVLLQKVTLPIYDLSDCQDVYGRDLVTRSNFCAGFITILKNVCNHDAGGPAILDGMLVGILSFSSKRCDQPDQPAVFSSVATVADWLGHLGDKRVRLRDTDIKSPEPI